MKLKELDFIKLLPVFMRSDKTNILLSKSISKLVKKLDKDLDKLSIWDRIDELTEGELDELAWGYNIIWYKYDGSIELKQRLIKNARKVYRTLGTVFATQSVINDYFPDAYLERWFQYGGKPHYFRIISNNPKILDVNFKEFLQKLEVVKKKSSWLDCIILQLQACGDLYFGSAPIDSGTDIFVFN